MSKYYNKSNIFFILKLIILLYLIYILYTVLFPTQEGFGKKMRRRMRRAARRAAEKAKRAAKRAAEKAAEETRKAVQAALKINKALATLFLSVLNLGKSVTTVTKALQ